VILEAVSEERSSLCTLDDGPGVPEHELSRITERGFRGRGGRTPSTGGPGLGLDIACRAARSIASRFGSGRQSRAASASSSKDRSAAADAVVTDEVVARSSRHHRGCLVAAARPVTVDAFPSLFPPPGVTGWTSRLRLRLCFQLVSTARYARLPAPSLSHGGSRRFNPYNAHRKTAVSTVLGEAFPGGRFAFSALPRSSRYFASEMTAPTASRRRCSSVNLIRSVPVTAASSLFELDRHPHGSSRHHSLADETLAVASSAPGRARRAQETGARELTARPIIRRMTRLKVLSALSAGSGRWRT
jgi:hypothetical protein